MAEQQYRGGFGGQGGPAVGGVLDPAAGPLKTSRGGFGGQGGPAVGGVLGPAAGPLKTSNGGWREDV